MALVTQTLRLISHDQACRGKHLQATKHEYPYQSDFASEVDVKLPNHRNWKAEDHDIPKERQSAIGSAADNLILAASMFDCLIIIKRNRSADCEVDYESCDSPAKRVCHICPGKHLESPRREEAHVEEQNRGFNTHKRRCISPL